jgi:hypothetical protein
MEKGMWKLFPKPGKVRLRRVIRTCYSKYNELVKQEKRKVEAGIIRWVLLISGWATGSFFQKQAWPAFLNRAFLLPGFLCHPRFL